VVNRRHHVPIRWKHVFDLGVVDSGQAELDTHRIDIVRLKLQPPYIDEAASVCNLFIAACQTPGNNQLIVIIVPATLLLELYVDYETRICQDRNLTYVGYIRLAE
jgi:hypothetical protein